MEVKELKLLPIDKINRDPVNEQKALFHSRFKMTETEAEQVFTIFNGLLDSLQTSVFMVSGEIEERLILRKTLPAYFALCSWPIKSVSGFLPYSLALEGQAIGCRHSVGVTSNDLYVCVAAPSMPALQQALHCLRGTNDLFLSEGDTEPPKLQVWLKGYSERMVEIPDYQGEDPETLDLDLEIIPLSPANEIKTAPMLVEADLNVVDLIKPSHKSSREKKKKISKKGTKGVKLKNQK